MTAAWAQTSAWELLAVALALAYLLLAVRQSRWCWAAALASTAIFSVLFWNVQLLMQSALNVYYMAMAVYGWWHWQHGGQADTPLPVRRWPLRAHARAIAVIVLAALLTGAVLANHSEAARPYLDALITWGAVVTTFMVARKVLENWAYWMVINSLAVVLFLDRGMQATAALHAAYLVISVFGWQRWRRDERAPGAASARG
ncbi:nicotinamide mononucleotide transporter [Wenzhouxiangella sp. XN79A]|nr:nicotinamide mononucleotide transporter [Wenzhouxiangella sp. XN79A]